MEQAIQLYGYLILTFFGFIAPITVILLSVFREGALILATQYEHEKAKSENNIRDQFNKKREAEETDLVAIERSLNELKAIKKRAETKLSYLDPSRQIIRLLTPLLLSFLGVVAFLVNWDSLIKWLSLLVSIIGFSYALLLLWRSLGIIIEAKKVIDSSAKDTETKIIELLSKLVEKSSEGAMTYLKKVFIKMNNIQIDDNSKQISLHTDIAATIPIAIINLESRMAKKVEAGFIFSLDFVIEKKNYYDLYIDERVQIVRYDPDFIHGDTDQVQNPIVITPLKKGNYTIRTFIKAENIEATYKEVTLKID